MKTFKIIALDGLTAALTDDQAPGMVVDLPCAALPDGARLGDQIDTDGGWVLRPAPRSTTEDNATLRQLASAMIAACAVTLGLSQEAARAALLGAI